MSLVDFWSPKNEQNAKAKTMYMAGVHLLFGLIVVIGMSIIAKQHSDYKDVYDLNVMKNIGDANIALYVVCALFFILVLIELIFWIFIRQSNTNGLYKLIMNCVSILFAIWGIACSSILVHQSMNPSYGNIQGDQTETITRIEDGYKATKDASVLMLIIWLIEIVYDIITLSFFFFDYELD